MSPKLIGDDAADAVAEQCPDGDFARRATGEIVAGNKDPGVRIFREIQGAGRILSAICPKVQVVEKAFAGLATPLPPSSLRFVVETQRSNGATESALTVAHMEQA